MIKLGDQSSDAAFAMYYGKFQGIAPKASQIITIVESRIEQNVEYELLLIEIHKMYLTQRAGVRYIAINRKTSNQAMDPNMQFYSRL